MYVYTGTYTSTYTSQVALPSLGPLAHTCSPPQLQPDERASASAPGNQNRTPDAGCARPPPQLPDPPPSSATQGLPLTFMTLSVPPTLARVSPNVALLMETPFAGCHRPATDQPP
eukprot:scaffold78064_cov42-Prasinocladus_malaysianus.AAC.1